MKVNTNQSATFADSLVDIPESGLDGIKAIIDIVRFGSAFTEIRTDYDPESLFRALLLREFYNLSYERLSDALKRDLVFMKFCGFSVSGGKPDATTLERFRDRLMKKGVWRRLLSKVNRVLEKEGLKINSGAAVADATLVPSARRPRKTFSADSEGNVSGPEYSDNPDAAWVTKAGRTVYGYVAFVATYEDGLWLRAWRPPRPT